MTSMIDLQVGGGARQSIVVLRQSTLTNQTANNKAITRQRMASQ